MTSRRIKNRQAVEAFTTACGGDDAVRAAFLGGSLAAGTDDAQSDLDLYVVTATDDDAAAYLARVGDALGSIGGLVFLDVIADFEGLGFPMVLFALDDGTDGELAIGTPQTMARLHGGPYEVLVDKDGLLHGVEFPLFAPDAAARVPQPDRLRRDLGWFWREVAHASKVIARDDLWAAQRVLARLRDRVQRLVDAHPAGAERDGLRAELARGFATFDRAAVIQAVAAMATLHRQIGPAVAALAGCDYPHDHARVACNRLFVSTGAYVN